MTLAKEIGLSDSVWEAGHVGEARHVRLLLDLYDREQVSLRRYLLFLGVDLETASETVQETFLRLHQHLLAGGEQTNLRAWLFRVAHNLARNAQTAFQTKRTSSLADVTSVVNPAVPDASAEETLLEQEQKARLQHAMRQLSAAQRNCLALRSQGLKYREIAESLNLSVSTVAENVQRGLEKLREML